MHVVGVGVDLVNVGVLGDLVMSGGAGFLNAGWTATEQRDAAGVSERLATRWAAKEAVMKALGRGLGDVDPLDIEIALGISGEPEVRLRSSASEAAETRGVGVVRVSMSHEYGLAVAFAVAVTAPAEIP